MLLQLAVRNVALMDRLVLEPAPGFNALTGETGAGKSMIIDALTLALGGRATPEILRTGEREAEVEALFEVEPASRIMAKLEAAGIPCTGEVLVRRVVSSSGGEGGVRSRAWINDRLSTAAQLAELAGDLCDIASQHENVSLTDPATHLLYLDAFGKLEGERARLGEAVDALLGIARALEDAQRDERERAEREDFLRFQLHEIDEVAPTPGEELELERERARLRHAERLGDATRRAAARLYEDESAICDELARLGADIEDATKLDPSLEPLARSLETARSELADAARALGRYAESVEANPNRLAEVDDRLFRLQKLLRRHGPTTDDLIAAQKKLAAEVKALAGASQRITDLEEKRATALDQVAGLARTLSRKRRKAADALADAIGRELAQLGMGRARVVVDVGPAHTPSNALAVDGASITRTGIDRVELLIAPNKGEEPRALRKIASGGELSRSLLAIKRVLAEKGPSCTYVFDEIDAGVGGAVAETIGRAMADVARHRQVICITHLPQIASMADVHFVVGKSEQKGRTMTNIRKLTDDQRVDEIARMIGGTKVSQAAKRAAEEMLRK